MAYTKSYSERLISNYIEEIEVQKKNIIKNFNQMDFNNADTKNECEKIVDEMLANCNELINVLNVYNFS